MNEAITAVAPFRLSRANFRAYPGRAIGVVLVLTLRYLFAVFFFGAGINKLPWLVSDKGRRVFTERLAELDPATFGAMFLEKFAIPLYVPISWIVAVGEFAVAVSLFLGLATRFGGALAIWLMVMFAIGGYYDASLIALWLIAALFVVFPSGHWLGMDRRLHERHPRSAWFR